MIQTSVVGPFDETFTISGDNKSGYDVTMDMGTSNYVTGFFLKDIATACMQHLKLINEDNDEFDPETHRADLDNAISYLTRLDPVPK
jgi:hypothetical protein